MILIRSRIMRWMCLQPYHLSTIKSSPLRSQSSKQNPFLFKSYNEIERMLSTKTYKANERIISHLILKAILQRIKQQNEHPTALNQREVQKKEQIVNVCLSKMLENIDMLSPDEILIIIDLLMNMYYNRSIKLKFSSAKIEASGLSAHMTRLIEQDKDNKHLQTFRQILFIMLKKHRKLKICQVIVQYLQEKDLKNNEEVLDLFMNFANYTPSLNSGDLTIEPILFKYLNSPTNTIQNSSEWVKPVVIKILQVYQDRLAAVSNTYVRKVMLGLENEMIHKRLSLDDQVLHLTALLSWPLLASPYFLKMEDVKAAVDIIYRLFKNISEEIQVKKSLSFTSFKHVKKVWDSFDEFAQASHKIIGKAQNEMLAQFNRMKSKSFQYGYLANVSGLSSIQLSSIVDQDLQLDPELQQEQVKKIIDHLTLNKNSESFHIQLRLYQFLAKYLLEHHNQQFYNELKTMLNEASQSCNDYKPYQILRLYNIYRVLGIRSDFLENYYEGSLQKDGQAVIENFTRTLLGPYSLQIIRQKCQKLIDSQNISKFSKSFWSSFKSVYGEQNESNKNSIFDFWFNKNIKFLQKLLSNAQNYDSVISVAIKEINSQDRLLLSSLQYEMLIQTLKITHDQRQKQNQDLNRILVNNSLRVYVEAENFRIIFKQQKYRHSFFVKALWALHLVCKYDNTSHKKQRHLRKIFEVMKHEKTTLIRQRINFRHSLILRNINLIDYNVEVKARNLPQVTIVWGWLNYNGLKWRTRLNQFQEHLVKLFMQKQKGFLYAAEFMLSAKETQVNHKEIGLVLSKSEVPPEILKGTLSEDTSISDTLLLNLLTMRQTVSYLLNKNPQISDVFVKKLAQMQKNFPLSKVIQAINLFQQIKQLLSKQTKKLFNNWVKQTLKDFINVTSNSSIVETCIEIGIYPKQILQDIDQYIKNELENNNIYIVDALYLNNHTGIAKSVEQLFVMCRKNRVIQFLNHSFEEQFTNLFVSFLGVSLNQQDLLVLKKCVNLFLSNHRQLNQIIPQTKNAKRVIEQLYLLIEIAKVRLTAQNKQQFQMLQCFEQSIKIVFPHIVESTLKIIIEKNERQLKKQGMVYQIDPDSMLHKVDNEYVLVDNRQPGYCRLAAEYLQKIVGVQRVRVLNSGLE